MIVWLIVLRFTLYQQYFNHIIAEYITQIEPSPLPWLNFEYFCMPLNSLWSKLNLYCLQVFWHEICFCGFIFDKKLWWKTSLESLSRQAKVGQRPCVSGFWQGALKNNNFTSLNLYLSKYLQQNRHYALNRNSTSFTLPIVFKYI